MLLANVYLFINLTKYGYKSSSTGYFWNFQFIFAAKDNDKEERFEMMAPEPRKTIETIHLNNDCFDSENLFSCLPSYYLDLVFLASLACSLI